MTRSSPVTTEPTLKRVQMLLCTSCLDGVGEECHTPGCAMYLHRVDLPLPKDTYTEVADEAAIASFLSFLSKDIASHPDKLRAFPATLAQRIADLTESVEFDPDAAQPSPDCGALRSTLEDVVAIYEWCSVDPVDRGYSALDNEIHRAKHLLASLPISSTSRCTPTVENE